MGRLSRMHPASFETPKGMKEDEVREAFRKAGIDPDYRARHIRGTERSYEVVPHGEEYEAKHYGSERLARAISAVVAPGCCCVLQFSALDGANWGWLVTSGRIEEINYVPTVGGTPLARHIAERRLEPPPNGIQAG